MLITVLILNEEFNKFYLEIFNIIIFVLKHFFILDYKLNASFFCAT